MLKSFLTKPLQERYAWGLWGLLFLVIAIGILFGSKRTVTGAYRMATQAWFQGQELYDGSGWVFLYLPQAGILFAPFAYLPHILGEILWRAVNISCFALGLWRLASLGSRDGEAGLFPLMSLFCVPLIFDAARNGQSTILMASLMMFSVADLATGRLWRVTFFLCLGFALKPLILVLILLVAALYRPMSWRLGLGIMTVILLPFLLQKPEYVLEQYTAFLSNARTATDVGLLGYWAQFFGMLKVAGLSVPPTVQTLVRLLFALLTLGLCFYAKKHKGAAQFGIWLYAFCVCYLMLFNPRTESNTYALLAPALGFFAARAFLIEKRIKVGLGLTGASIGVAGSYEIGKLITATNKAVWLAPLICTLFFIYLVHELFTLPSGWDAPS